MSTRSTLLTAVAIVGAVAVGRLFSSDAPAPAQVTAPQPSAPSLSSAEIRSAMRAELAREPRGTTTIVTHEAATIEEEAPAPEVIEQRATALAQARVIVSAAVGAGKWTSDDARKLGSQLAYLGPDEHDEILTSLIASLNSGRVKVETNGSFLDPL